MTKKTGEPQPTGLANKLRTLREAAGLTQGDLAKRADLHLSVVFKIEQGVRTDPSWQTVQALAAALGVTCEAFAGDMKAADEKPVGKSKPSTKRKTKS